MAIDQIPYPDTEDFVNVKSRRFWPVQIPISHWQLRHFLSTSEPNRLYYAAGPEVFCLDTKTKQHRLIATLPFNARCTASGYGWVGVGGEKEGHYFAAIKLDGSGPRTLDVDSALSLEAWRGARRAPSVRVEKVGEQIVNSISIHRLRDDDAHLDDIVAVLTNNDKTVRVFSMPQNTEAYTLDLPHPVNHATISPDGKSMIVVGDYAQAFVCSRRIKRSPPQIPKPHNRLTSADLSWELIGEYDLFVSNKSAPQGYFSTAWSPDGRFAAVGSEDGYITVFDADIITKTDADPRKAIVTIIPSSRPGSPNPYPGGVRAMIFSPAPWDLLIWAEDQGRVCVSDLRTGLRVKQVLTVDPNDDNLDRVMDTETIREGAGSLDDFDRLFSETQRDLASMESDFLRRHRDHGLESSYGFVPNYVEARRWERQRVMARLRTGYTDDPQGLTAREQQILDTLRLSRQRQEAHFAAAGNANVNYTNPDVIAPYSMRARMMTGDSSNDVPELVRTPMSATREGLESMELPTQSPDSVSEVYDLSTARNASANNAARLPRAARDGSGSPSTTWRGRGSDDESAQPAHRSGRSRGQWSSMFLPTPPRSQPTTSSSATDSAARPTRHDNNTLEEHEHGSEETHESDDDDDDDDDDADDDGEDEHNQDEEQEEETANDNVWRSLDDAILNTQGPLFEYAARAQPEASNLGEQSSRSRTSALRDDREFRQRYLVRQRERLRAVREEAAATLSRANDHAELPTLSRTRAAVDDFDFDGFLRQRVRDYGRDLTGRTAGLAMSEDGSMLWIACEEGIFEFEMNRKARMFWPAIEPR